jgi:uncharacterized CHY-type Zn-finger protein
LAEVEIGGFAVSGVGIDANSRCEHYHSELDIVALRFPCCDRYYACFECHQALAGHEAGRWPLGEFGQKAILCGACGIELTIAEYLEVDSKCPVCGALFNPGCKNHFDLYFER